MGYVATMLSVLLLPALAFAEDPWFYLDEGEQRVSIAPDSTIAGLPVRRTGAVVVATTAPDALAALPGILAVEPLGRGDSVFRLRTAPGTDEIALSRALHDRADVAWANPDLALPLVPLDLPDDPYVADQWHLQNVGQWGWTPGCDIDAPTAWALSTGAGMMVAVIDTGVDTDHPDLRVTPGWDYVDGDPDPNPDPAYDGWPHGTCAAGLAAATGDNALGVAGVAWDAELYAIRLIGGATTYSDIYDAFVEASEAGAAVISNSWGFQDCQDFLLPATIRAGLDHAEEEGRGGLGTAVVFSAGNGNCDASHDGMLTYGTVVGVGAVNGDDDREWYSSHGSMVDVVAPSGAVLTTDPAGSDGYGAWRDDPDYYGYFSGTSAAAPVVSGTLALMFAANPRLTAQQAREVLCATADRIHPEDWDYDERGWSAYMGFGRIDAGAAVLAVANAAPSVPVVLGPEGEAWEDAVVLRWEAAEDDDGDWLTYTVTWWTAEDTTSHVEQTPATTLDLTGLVQADDEVFWQVRATDLWGPGDYPAEQRFTVRALPERPEPPATGCATTPRRPRLAWVLLLAGLALPRRRSSY